MRLSAAALLSCALLSGALLLGAAARSYGADSPAQSEALKDCVDKQQASNTTHLTPEQILKACHDQMRAPKAKTPAAVSRAKTQRASEDPSVKPGKPR